MPFFTRCPRCFARLRVSADLQNESVTCPRCLAELPKSGQGSITATAANVPRSEGVCPECGEPVGPGWHYCASCQEPLRGQDRRERPRSMELDVRRDNYAVRVFMIVLAVLGGVVIVSMLLHGIRAAKEEPALLLCVLAGLFVIGLSAALTVLFSKEKMGVQRAIGLTAYRSLVIVGLLIVFAVNALMLLIVLIVACTAVTP